LPTCLIDVQAKFEEVGLPHGGGELMLMQNLTPKISLATLIFYPWSCKYGKLG
jgi:hypothetical protein